MYVQQVHGCTHVPTAGGDEAIYRSNVMYGSERDHVASKLWIDT